MPAPTCRKPAYEIVADEVGRRPHNYRWYYRFFQSALKGEFEGLRRLRVGHYRVVYEWQRSALVILVVRVGHRREVYR